MPCSKKKNAEPRSQCPLDGFTPCRTSCAWHNGAQCSLFMLAQESYVLVEVLQQGMGTQQTSGMHPAPPAGEAP